MHDADTQDGPASGMLHHAAAEMLEIGKSRREIEDALMGRGIDRVTASGVVTEVLDSEWQAEGGGEGLLGEVGVRHMMIGALMFGFGVAATFGSAYFVEFTGYYLVAYGAVGAGAIEFVYGLLRFFDGP